MSGARIPLPLTLLTCDNQVHEIAVLQCVHRHFVTEHIPLAGY